MKTRKMQSLISTISFGYDRVVDLKKINSWKVWEMIIRLFDKNCYQKRR